MLTTNEIRQKFLEYFKKNQHTLVASGSLIPANDPTLLFTNAGMVPFKETFLGLEQRNYNRATSSQCCVRAGGKHNDLENVGFTARHHTFFEMLGNFSFGNYFKREAIQFAWQFLTKELNIPTEKLWVTVYKDDQDAEDIWLKEMNIDPKRFSRCGAADNFWSMGDTGPCGPCTEIFYDHGPEIAGGPPGTPEQEGDRYTEIWNLVFMQYERQADGELKPLPKPSVDTGMGLERIAAVLQGVHSNYDIDLFQNLIKAAAKLTHCKDLQHTSLKVIADHIRSCGFLIAEGITPSNEGRGYVLRRIIRRALRHGNKLGIKEAFFYRLVDVLIDEMGETYPVLAQAQPRIEKTLKTEEEQFARTLDKGLKILNDALSKLESKQLPGKVAFKLYDTYGFPVDLTADILREQDVSIDMPGFKACMAEQQAGSKSQSQFKLDYTQMIHIDKATVFTGHTTLEQPAKTLLLFNANCKVDSLSEGEQGSIVLDTTSFYAESGGQVGDQGEIIVGDHIFKVTDTQKAGNAFIHHGLMTQGRIKIGEAVLANVNPDARRDTMANHSATHLLHAAMHQLLGDQVLQRGSMVGPERLRFDFTYHEAIAKQDLQAIEQCVNQLIRNNSAVETTLMTPDQAKQDGALALFGEKYGDEVRVLTMGKASKELCGGTHVKNTGDIGTFKIISESSIASGVRRIEAVTGVKAMEYIQQLETYLQDSAACFNTRAESLPEKIASLQKKTRAQEKQIDQFKAKLAGNASKRLAEQFKEIDGIKFIAAEAKGTAPKELRGTVDNLKDQLGSGVIVLASNQDNRVSLVAGVTKDLTDRLHAGRLVNYVAEMIGGKGGGRPDMAQAGGQDASQLPAALASVEAWIQQELKR